MTLKRLQAALLDHVAADHLRGCEMRRAACDCGYEDRTEQLLRQAATRIEELEQAIRGQALDEQDG